MYRICNYHKKDTYWLCVCKCGNLKEVKLSDLTSGHTKSCGCLQIEVSKRVKNKHGKRYTRIYSILANMKQRCYNKNNKRYKHYGGRGIAVCGEWKDDFQAFYDWSMVNGYADNLTIDRIDNNGNYEPNNCRWVTMKQQQRNKRKNKIITYKGESKSLAEWCENLGLNYHTIQQRLYRGWNIKKALQ